MTSSNNSSTPDTPKTRAVERRVTALLTTYAEDMPRTTGIETRLREWLAAPEGAQPADPARAARWLPTPRGGAPHGASGWARAAVSMGLVAALIGGFFVAGRLRHATETPRTGYTLTRCDSAEAVPHATNAPSPAQPAIYTTTAGGRSLNASLYAFAPDSGAVRWCDQFSRLQTSAFTCPTSMSCPVPPLTLVGQPLVTDGALYVCVSGYGGYTYALNAGDGAVRWMRQSDCAVGSIPFADYARPVLANGTLFSGVFALDSRDGAVRWRLPDGVAPGMVDGSALYAYTQTTVSTWDIGSGKSRWSYTLPDLIGGAPTVANGIVYVGDIGGDSPPAATPDQPDTFALDARTGKLLWRAPTGIVLGSPVVVGATVYVGGLGPALFALDAATGHIRWRYDTRQTAPSTPAVHDGVIYFTADGVYAVDAATGAPRWRQPLGASQSTWFTAPTLTTRALYLGQTSGNGMSALYALSMSDGSVLWKHTGLDPVSPPVAAE